jgi:long-chain acyl-CoA synthetase
MMQFGSISNLAELLLFQADNYSNPKAFNFKENGHLKSFSNQDFLKKATNFGYGLNSIGFARGKTLAIFSYQNPIWLMVDFATILIGGVSVPIFSNISPLNLGFEIEDAGVEYIFIDDIKSISLLEESGKISQLKTVITYGFEVSDKTKYQNINFLTFEEVIALGVEEGGEYDISDFIAQINEDDIATIIYTSGSTGNPNGVELSHKNLISQIKATAKLFSLDKNNDVALSFLPLAHIFEGMVIRFYISQGISIYFADDIKNLGNLIKEIKPTLMTSVPRMLEKVFSKIKEKTDNFGGFKKFLATKSVSFAADFNPSSINLFLKLVRKFYDILVYKKIREDLGGNLRMIICGGAALNYNIEKFFNNIGINLYVGYGLTETSPVIAVNCHRAHNFGTVGRPFDLVEVRLAADNELLVKGPNVMKSYHRNQLKTKEAFDSDGWFKTGDLAQINKNGFIKIIGRKKELFKTANGKYVSPVPIEQQLNQKLEFLIGSIIIAEGKKFVSAILFPDFEILPKFKQKFLLGKFNNLNDQEFLQNPALQDKTQQVINEINKKLNHSEQIEKFYIATESISISSGEITPSMKLKRNVLEKKYEQIIEKFYI